MSCMQGSVRSFKYEDIQLMKKLALLGLSLLVTACTAVDTLNKELQDFNQAGIYRKYISSTSKTKVLVVGSLPSSRQIESWGEYFSSTYSDRYYFSTEQDSIETAMVEALEYCRIDSSWNGKEENNCRIAMVLDFNANEVERAFGEFLNLHFSDYFEITIKNLEFHPYCRFNLANFLDWSGCSINIRPKVELPKSQLPQARSLQQS